MQDGKVTLKNEGGKNIIYVEGTVNSLNSQEFKDELTSAINGLGGADYAIDMAGLEYISSAGLRVLLSLSQDQEKKVKVINVIPEVFDIFRTTGFDKLLDAQQQLREVSIEGCEMIGQGANGWVYRIDRDTIIKVYREGTDDAIIDKERELAHQCFMNKIPTAIPYDVVKCGNTKGIVFEMLKSQTLSTMLNNEPEKWDEYLSEYTKLMKKVHSANIDPDLFPSIKSLYTSYFDFCRKYYNDDEWDKMQRLLKSLPEATTMVHGDFHPKNIMVLDGELMLIDMGDVSYGHPLFDFIAMSVSMPVLARENEPFGEQVIGMKGNTIVPFWRGFIKQYFDIADDAELDRVDDLLCRIGRLKRLVVPAVATGIDEAVALPMMEDAKNTIFPKLDELISYDWNSLFNK